jgi:hypothetical protein
MPKILFPANAVLMRGDGSGPRFEAGKVYLLPPDACMRWKRRNKAVDAPDDAPAVNEPLRPPPRARDVAKAEQPAGKASKNAAAKPVAATVADGDAPAAAPDDKPAT